MNISRYLWAPTFGLALSFLQGCSAWQVNQIAGQLPAVGAAQALQQLEKVEPPERDRAQYLLNRGTLQFYLGELQASRTDLAEAQGIMAALQATSVSENLAAVSTNETLRSYTGTPTDQVMVHVLLALAFLGQGDLDGARVEILQSQVEMQRLATADSTSGQLAIARYLAGVIYELNREWDSALISYRQAWEILQQLEQPIPLALQDGLLQMTQRMGLKDEQEKFRKAFGHDAVLPAQGEGELFVLHLDGVVSSKQDARMSIVAGANAQLITLVVPTYPHVHYHPHFLTLTVNGHRISTEIIENLDERARADLEAELPTIMATTTARAVAKYNMVNEMQNRNGIAGLLANLVTAATEQADVRSWNMLPASIQVARIRVPSGAQVSTSSGNDAGLAPLQAAAAGRMAVLVTGEMAAPSGFPPVIAAPPAASANPAVPQSSSTTEAGASP